VFQFSVMLSVAVSVSRNVELCLTGKDALVLPAPWLLCKTLFILYIFH